MKELDLEEVFAEGARSVASEHGMGEKDAEAFAGLLVKQARPKPMRSYDEDDEEDGTWWSRNKGWALPSAVGLGSFLLGGAAGRYGRPDWNHFSNAGRLILEALQRLVGIPNSALWRSVTIANPHKIIEPKSKETKELDELLSAKYDVPKIEGGANGPLFKSTVGGRMGEVSQGDRALVIPEAVDGDQSYESKGK